MIFVLVLIVTVMFSLILTKGDLLIKNASIFYALALIMNFIGVYLSFTYQGSNPIVNLSILVLKQGLIGMALFVIVMYLGAVKNSKWTTGLYKARGELSILGVIFVLNHGIYYFINLLRALPTWLKLPPTPLFLNLMVLLLSTWIVIICIPLFVTSFKKIRKKMSARDWKKLQRFSYMFYTLVYAHIVAGIMVRPMWYNYVPNLLVYSVIFFVYVALRLHKEASKKKEGEGSRRWLNSLAILSILVLLSGSGGIITYSVQQSSKDMMARTQNSQAPKKVEDKNGNDRQKAQKTYYKNGTFVGRAKGYSSTIEVELTIKNDTIKNLKIIKIGDDGPYVESASKLISIIKENNSTNVDTISGATFTSNGIIGAVNNALEKAVN